MITEHFGKNEQLIVYEESLGILSNKKLVVFENKKLW